jgi:citrate synthase
VTAIATDEQRAAIDRFVAPTRGVDPPNVDAALGALGFVGAMEVGRTEAVFAVARTAGWLAHAFEEADEAPVRFRGRTLYRGPR